MQIGKSELIIFCPLGLNLKNLCGKCMPSSRFSGFLQVLISHASKYVSCDNLCQYVRYLKNPMRWCGQSVNNVPLKLTCASVCLQPLFDVLWAGWKILVSLHFLTWVTFYFSIMKGQIVRLVTLLFWVTNNKAWIISCCKKTNYIH